VPIHSKLRATVEHLVSDRKADFVLASLTADKYGDRSPAIGKRFGRLKTALGFGPKHVFHSIRHTVATLLENAGVPEGVSADIIEHDKDTMTYGLYSGGASLEVKRNAIEKLRYT
jgi:integrase